MHVTWMHHHLRWQVESEQGQLQANMQIDMTVDQNKASESAVWCENHVKTLQYADGSWQSLNTAVDCSLWPEYVRIATASPGTYGYYVSGNLN